MKRKWLNMILAVTMLSTIGSASVIAQADSDEEVVLSVYGAVWQEIPEQIEILFDTYQQEHPNVSFEFTADSSAFQTMIAAKNYPDIVVELGYATMAYVVEYLEDLSGEDFWDQIDESAWPAVTYEDKRYMVPLNSESYGLIYNKELFREAGFEEPPKTFEELKQLCEALEANGITPFSSGYKESWILEQLLLFPFHDSSQSLSDVSAKLCSGELSSKDTKFYQEYQSFLDYLIEHCQNKPLEADYTTQVTLFAAGEAAMLSNGDWTAGMITEINPDIEMGLMGIPYSADPEEYKIYNSVSNCIGTFKDCEHKEAALDFIRWLITSDEGKNWIGKVWCVPSPIKGIEADINPLSKDGTAAGAGGYSADWGGSYLPQEAQPALGLEAQKYLIGEATWDDVLTAFDKAIVENS